MKLSHEFVTSVPETLEQGVVYVSIEYRTAIHACCCGCRGKVVTPLSPTGWELTFDGKTISLYPSIGNWGFECRSHYWITKNTVEWAPKWSDKQVEHARRKHDVEKKPNPKKKKGGLFGSLFKKNQ